MTDIANWTQLAAIAADLTGDYVLTANLDKNTVDYVGIGDVWASLGNFSGTFDGQGHSISDLILLPTGQEGFFNDVSGTISNLTFINPYCGGGLGVVGDLLTGDLSEVHVVNGYISYSGNNGGLFSTATTAATINDCSFTGYIKGNGSGGIVGTFFEGVQINRAYVKATIVCSNGGGIVGTMLDGGVYDAYADCNISAINFAGGIVGGTQRYGGNGFIQRCFATGLVISPGATGIGGFIGTGDSNQAMQDNVSIAVVTGKEKKQYVGSFCGDKNAQAITNCAVLQTSYPQTLKAIGDLAVDMSPTYGTDVTNIEDLYAPSHAVYSTWSTDYWIWTAQGLPFPRSRFAVWTGTGNASTQSNWSRPLVDEDIVIFNATSTADCTIDSTVRWKLLIIESGYTGTITQEADMYLGEYLQADGEFLCYAPFTYKFNMTKKQTITAGTFNRAAVV